MNETTSITETLKVIVCRMDRKVLLRLKNEARSDLVYEVVLAELVRRG